MKETKGLRVIMIFEIIGRPKKHIVDSLVKIIDAMDAEQDVSVLSKNIKEPTLVKDQKDMYSTFAEVELEVASSLHLAALMFKYMPAHIEIVTPETVALTNNELGEIFNEVGRRLHGYDEVARILQLERATIEKKLREILDKHKEKQPKKKPSKKAAKKKK